MSGARSGRRRFHRIFTVGFFLIYGFWCAYGLRFGRIGIWLPNARAAALQVVFSAIVFSKAT